MSSYSIISYAGKDLPTNYQALLFSSWLHTLYSGNAQYRSGLEAMRLGKAHYYLEYHKYIESLLQKPDCIVKLAVLTEDHDIVLGYSVSREDVLDYVFVQKDQQGQKISNALMPNPMTAFTHTTSMWHPIWQSKYKECEFKPRA